MELDRARRAVELAKQRYLAVDPAHRSVAALAEKNLEQRIRELDNLERGRDIAPGPADAFTEDAWDELCRLATSVDSILDADTTTNRDRKELVRILVRRLTVDYPSRVEVRARIEWSDGGDDTFVMVRRPFFATERLRRLAHDGKRPSEIASILRSEKLKTRTGADWTAAKVRQAIYAWKSKGRPLRDQHADGASEDDGSIVGTIAPEPVVHVEPRFLVDAIKLR